MQTVSAAWRSAYDTGSSLYAQPKVVIEWNWNRYSASVAASNGGAADIEPVNFPITSIIANNRPGRSLTKARVGQARTYNRQGNDVQYRTVGPTAIYKYWTSSAVSGTSLSANSGYAISGVSPSVVYGASVSCNKITILVETNSAAPKTWNVQTTTDGTNWSTVYTATNQTMTSEFNLYRQSGGTWTTTPADFPTNILGVRLNVLEMSAASRHANIVEISAKLEKDISSDVISVSINKETEEADEAYPIGKMTSNSATITLDNTTKNYDVENATGPYYKLIDTNAKIKIFFGVDTSSFGGAGMEYIQQGVFYSDAWNPNTEDTTVELTTTDGSKFLQDAPCLPALYVNKTAAQIISEILASQGIADYTLDIANVNAELPLKYVWFDKNTTVWAAIQSIVSATQGVAFFDETGFFVYRSKNAIFASSTVNYKISSVPVASVLPNLSELEASYNTQANKITVNYTTYKANSNKVVRTAYRGRPGPLDSRFGKNIPYNYYDEIPVDSILWRPEDTVTLRARPLKAALTTTSNTVTIDATAISTWPYTGMFNIEGEVMSYDGLEYRYYNKLGNPQIVTIKSVEEKKEYDDLRSLQTMSYKNGFTGRFMNVERAQLGTNAAAHAIDIAGWACFQKKANNTVVAASARMKQVDSEMILYGQRTDGYESFTHASRGAATDKYKAYGTSVRFQNSGYGGGTAGMFIQMQTDRKQGYYIELNTTKFSTQTMKGQIANIRVYRMAADGSKMVVTNAPVGKAGIPYNIVPNQRIRLDVTYDATTNYYKVFVNGMLVAGFIDPNGTLGGGKWGVFVRGHTIAAFEYFYTFDSTAPPEIGNTSFQHKIEGGFVSGFADQEIARKSQKAIYWFMDDFGPWVHEVRKFTAKFDKTPAVDSYPYSTNDWGTYTLRYSSTPFTATWYLANSARKDSVVSGEDVATLGSTNAAITQQIAIYGQLVTESSDNILVNTNTLDDEKLNNNIISTNDFSIRKSGIFELTFDNEWIQTKQQAQEISDWIIAHWAQPVDTITVKGFFDPALQLGDRVSVNYPDRSMAEATHQYHVIGSELEFSSGISTSLTLRRIR